MNKGRIFETLVGVAVIAAAALFLVYAYQQTGRGDRLGAYTLNASFGRIDGVAVGSDVNIAGVKVGSVIDDELDPKTYEARLVLSIAGGVGVPEDSIAKISSNGILGGASVSIEPGASDVMLKAGETIVATQGSIDFISLAVDAFTSGAARPAAPAVEPATLPPIESSGETP